MKYFLNIYIFIWASFGFIIYSGYTIYLFNNSLFKYLTFLDWIIYLMPYLIILIYCLLFIKHRFLVQKQ